MKLLRQKKRTPRPRLGAPIRFYRDEASRCCFIQAGGTVVLAGDEANNDRATLACWRKMGAM